ncbi:hypothetical protein Scep_014436 [Stephania cephalantha]|uniref:Uncharacterized protein n=1 Tax=Stephania cephalantha TaxID=152367 RepID=A0AAP0P1P8_9MAGN
MSLDDSLDMKGLYVTIRVTWCIDCSQCSLRMGTSKVLLVLDEGIKILDEDERQRSTLWNDGIDVEHAINEDNEEEDEEEDHGESNREVRRRTTQTEIVGESTRHPRPPHPSRRTKTAAESSKRSPPPRSSCPRARRIETVGESSQHSFPPRQSSYGYIVTLSLMQPEPEMFVPRLPIMNLPPYHFDPYAHRPSFSYMDNGMQRHPMYHSLPQYMPSPFTPPCYNYNISYSGDDSFMNLLSMLPPHVPFDQPHKGSQYFGTVQPPIFGSISTRGESSEPEEEDQSTQRNSMQDRQPQQTQSDVQTQRPTQHRVRPVCIMEQQCQRNRR